MITESQVFDLLHFCDETKISLVKDALSLSNFLYLRCQEEKEKQPFEFNVISCALVGQHMKEVAHSAILANLLQHPKVREQFFNCFLPNIVNFDACANPEIQAENARIDVSICAKNKYFVIIENKVNGANDQENQIARYVQHAYSNLNFDYSKIHVVYINPTGHKQPEEQSLTLESGDSVLDKIGHDNFTILSFKEDIYEFIKGLINSDILNTDSTNRLLIGGLEQYKTYLRLKFNINPDMINAITKALENELNHKQLDTSFEGLYCLRQRVTDVLNDVHCLIWQKLMEHIIEKYPSIGVQAKDHEILFIINAGIGVRICTYYKSIYWALYSNNPDEHIKSTILEILEKSGLEKGGENNIGDIVFDYFNSHETMLKDRFGYELPNQTVLDATERLIKACQEVVGNFSGCSQSNGKFITQNKEDILNEAMEGKSSFTDVLDASEKLLNLCIYIDNAIAKTLKTQLNANEVSTGSEFEPYYDIYPNENRENKIWMWPHFPNGNNCIINHSKNQDKVIELQARECPTISQLKNIIETNFN